MATHHRTARGRGGGQAPAQLAALAVGLSCSGLPDEDRIAELCRGADADALASAAAELGQLTFLGTDDRERARALLHHAIALCSRTEDPVGAATG
jgi:hypothetical protein